MDVLAEELRMSKRTLYAHFPSKMALLEAVVHAKFDEVESDLRKIAAERTGDFFQALHVFLTCVQEHTAEIQPTFLRDVQREAPEFFQLVRKRRRETILRYFTRLFAAGRKAGIIRRDISAKVLIEILLGATEAVVNPQKLTELNLSPRAGYSAVISVILDGAILGRKKKGEAQR